MLSRWEGLLRCTLPQYPYRSKTMPSCNCVFSSSLRDVWEGMAIAKISFDENRSDVSLQDNGCMLTSVRSERDI